MTPISWRIKPLHCGYGVLLVYSDATEAQIGMSSATERGLRGQMSKHPDYRGLVEDRPPIGTPVERFPPPTISAGPFFCDGRAGIGSYKVALFPDPLDDPYAPMMPDLITQEGGEW